MGDDADAQEGTQDIARPFCLISGNLTDPVDWPGHEDEIGAAEAEVERAAAEWLVVEDDPEYRDRCFHRWQHAQRGCPRPPA